MSEVRKANKGRAAARAPMVVPWRWIGVGASLVLLLLMVWSVFRLTAGPSSDELRAREVVSNHVRSLMAAHITDVPSSDQHTVKPWFNGKLDFSPPVINLDEQGFNLVGGRLDYLDNRAIAAVVYKRNQHLINLFIWPTSESDRSVRTEARQGYNVIHWRRDDMNYWAVSDLNATELREFVELARTR